MEITRRDIDDAHRFATDAMKPLVASKTSLPRRAFDRGIEAVEVMGAAAVVGILTGRFGPLSVNVKGADVPIDLTAGVAGAAVALASGSDHLANVSLGVLAAYATRWGAGVGTGMRIESGQAPVNQFAGTRPQNVVFGAAPSRPPTDAELLALARGR